MYACSVTLTHRLGHKLAPDQWEPAHPGLVKMVIKTDENGGNRVQVMSMDSLAQFGATIRSPIPDLYEPQMLKFNSEKGMMVVGFEEIDGRRYYQGWWITWRNLMA